jgi:hypothetical protein
MTDLLGRAYFVYLEVVWQDNEFVYCVFDFVGGGAELRLEGLDQEGLWI